MNFDNPFSGKKPAQQEGLVKQDIPVVEGEVVEEGQPSSEAHSEMKVSQQESLMNTDYTVPSGEHFIINKAMNSDIVVSPGAKLTVKGSLMNSDVNVKKGGIFELEGKNLNSDITRE